MNFTGRDILSTEDLSREDILQILKVTARMEKLVRSKRIVPLLTTAWWR